MKEIKLTQGKVALVSDEWFEELNRFKWHVLTGYAARNTSRIFGKQKHIWMHKVVAGASSETEVDHVDRNRLNNQVENLRVCTSTQNKQNRCRYSNNTSGYKGVTYHQKSGKWRARIDVDRQSVYLGYYATPEEAARVYDEAAKKYHGEFAKLNF